MPEKLLDIYGARLKLEASYLGGGTTAATDAVLLAEPAVAGIDYTNKADRPNAPGTGARRDRLAPTGLILTDGLTLKTEVRGPGTAYSASNLPLDQHVLLRISGHTHVVDTTPSAEKVTYTPASALASMASAIAELYGRAELLTLIGAYADLELDMPEDGGPLIAMAHLRGVPSALPSDASLPALTYFAATSLPPKCDSVVLTIGGVSLKVRRWNFKANRVISGPRSNRNAVGHSGFAMSPNRNPTVTMTVEAVDLATFNPYTKRNTAVKEIMTFTIPGADYKKFQFNALQSQCVNVQPAGDDVLALWDLTYECKASGLAADDDYSLVYPK